MGEVSLRDHVEALIEALDQRLTGVIADRDTRVAQAFTASKEAVDKANESNERRLNMLNHIREERKEEQAQFARSEALVAHITETSRRFEAFDVKIAASLPSESYERRHAELEGRVGVLERWRENVTGRTVGLALVGGVIIAAVSAFLAHLVAGG